MANEKTKNTFEITLADGTQIGGLELNGNNFISKSPVTEGTFAGKLGNVKISCDGEYMTDLVGKHSNMELIKIQQHGAEYWFILRDIPAGELEKLQTQSDVAYIAMMTGVELD